MMQQQFRQQQSPLAHKQSAVLQHLLHRALHIVLFMSPACLAHLTPPPLCLLLVTTTPQVLQECHAAIGMYQAELLHEVACILRTQHTNSPAAARTRQAAMDALRHFGAGGVDAYRQARQFPGGPGAPAGSMTMRDPGGLRVWRVRARH